MTTDILYYPFMRPKERWLRAALLFCDHVLTIVPQERSGLEWLSKDTREIVERLAEITPPPAAAYSDDRELPATSLIQLDPHDLIYEAFGETLTSEVKRYYKANAEAKWFHEADIEKWVSMAADKLPQDLWDWLKQEDLYVRVVDDPDMGRVHPNVGNFLMNRLASHMSGHFRVPSATDMIQDFACNALRGIEKPKNQDENVQLLGWSLPIIVPGEIALISPDDYLEIRKRYQEIAVDVTATMGEIARHHRIDDWDTLQDLAARLEAAKRRIETGVKTFLEKQTRFKDERLERMAVGGLVEVVKNVPIVGAAVGIGERLVVEGTRRIEVPPTSTQAIYANLAALAEEVVDLASPIRNHLAA